MGRGEPGERPPQPLTVSGQPIFHLGDWIDVRLCGFSHQNVIYGLTVKEAGEREVAGWELGVGLRPGLHEIEMKPCFGAYGTIRATILRIEHRPDKG